MITKRNLAYKIGFAAGLKPETYSGYNEMGQVEISDDTKVQFSFLRGYKEGVTAVQEENASLLRSKKQLLVG